MNAWFETKAYLKHLIHAGGPHSVHSPSVFELLTQVLVTERKFQCFEKIEIQRAALFQDKRSIRVNDLGAGSRVAKNDIRKISAIAKYVLQNKKCAQSIFKIAEHYRPDTIIELGTSLGITTSYLASISRNTQVYSIEGSSEIAAIGRESLQNLGLDNVEIVTGSFETILPELLKKNGRADLILIDGNHRYAPTIKYFEEILPYCHENSILIFDDIHWSSEMEKAWEEIRTNNKIKISVDFFHFGLLMFNKVQEKQHFCLRLP